MRVPSMGPRDYDGLASGADRSIPPADRHLHARSRKRRLRLIRPGKQSRVAGILSRLHPPRQATTQRHWLKALQSGCLVCLALRSSCKGRHCTLMWTSLHADVAL